MPHLPFCRKLNATPLCVEPISIPITILVSPSHGPRNGLGVASTDPLDVAMAYYRNPRF
ncbi:hypothetical protein AG1IA_09187 [Rhizoctonia solani AG-1 IA]|uniref:Uncharacterized protein n=1 Tax=Thanatephorus cucumeris (strain AG1-IA) TaxID=983506 RepID=L8WFS1_THACA|nr:hypothetical protein AG1IA_09187 [Rhizoctonia solani AG-1 IA]